MLTILMSVAGLAILQPGPPLTFEAEEVAGPAEAWLEDDFTEDHWNLWSTDVDADEKWSGGVTLQSPRVMEDRESPEDGAPPLHVVIEDIPEGTFGVDIKYGRALAVSLDGDEWIDLSETRGRVGVLEIGEDGLELWVDDLFAQAANPGSSYFDTITLTPLPDRRPPAPVEGWADERVTESLGRGLVALPTADGVYLSWRLLPEDPGDIAFDVYRRAGRSLPMLVTLAPISETTDYLDDDPPGMDCAYAVVPAGEEPGQRGWYYLESTEPRPNYLSIPFEGEYHAQKVGVADLDGDGRYDYVIKQPSDNIDPYVHYWYPSPETFKLEAYTADGQFLWRRDLGWGIERGIWYSPYIAFDLDGDGRAEVAAKTSEGDPRDDDGRVTSGPEYLTLFDGLTGEEIDRVDWIPREWIGEMPSAYNYASRNQLGIAYLDGKTPCLLMARGTYTNMFLRAFQLVDGSLEELWTWDSRYEGGSYRGQGAHFMHSADVDGDGRDEVILGSAVIDDTGAALWSTGLGHPDHCYVGDIDPGNPGLEIYYGIEPGRASNAVCLVDAATGEVLWGIEEQTRHVHNSGLCADLDARYPGLECYSGEKEWPEDGPHRWLHSAAGELLATETELDLGLSPRAVYWDGDPQRELLLGTRIVGFPEMEEIDVIDGSSVVWADVVGDWREEIIARKPGELRIYITTIPATDRHPCLMTDTLYRIDVANLAMGYAQPPMLSTGVPR
ncbi:MAG: silent information regulator protein Sir2 [Armatimonadia bacterium]|nr:silent information regulator protein Sir2 [Armatimonadia bacterium]